MKKKTPARKRYGRRAEGKTQTSITLTEKLLDAAKAEAEKRGTTLSALVEESLAKIGLKSQ